MREPLIPEFACSGRFATQCTQAGWNASQMERSTHFWIAAEALSGPFTVRQCELGMRPLVQRSREGLPDLFTRVVGSAFATIEAHGSTWVTRTGSEETPTVGTCPPLEAANDVPPDGTRFLAKFAEDVHNLAEVLGGILSPETYAAIVAASTSHRGHRYPDELWAATLADFLLAFHHGVMRRDHITQALLPLYIARTGAFILEHGTDSPGALDAALESLCGCLEKAKARLVAGWEQQHEVQHG
jgi:hypothetical protein